ncbi:siderophore-interacting protein [Rhodococcus rhodnii]|uniref:FAD-binding FR-type domain-containing protein n=2 Tax=Rhodococcus rhodnii TaxID=38312 RepID=R7WL16_9NOCA|nr:siderophore-interacting protein [Rhodococcus rhodnii]EOM75992.1 hypothetical protein Rrhod_2640 [Rhodococcus rhodnii LMG 5362]TXG90833.1 siderophore-interacting protein [Rhodococcus rhodnii]
MAKPTATVTVLRTERIAPHLVRVYLGGPGFDEFVPSSFTDMYVKAEFDVDGETVLRTYTIRSVDTERREIAIDFVVHGDIGVAGPWATAARPGDTLTLRGPGGAYAPDPSADWHLLAGDETAIPAIGAALSALPESAVGDAVIEVGGTADEIDLAAPAGVTVHWVHRGASSDEATDERAGDNAPLVGAVKSLPWRAGEPHVFVHGEAQAVMHNLRPYIRKERGVPAARASISGYWRRGRTEEGFRVWKRELSEREAVG